SFPFAATDRHGVSTSLSRQEEHPMTYALLHTLHLLSAILFIGAVFVEVAMLAQAKRALAPDARETLERALGARSRVVLHWVVLVVYGAGIGLAWFHRGALADPLASSFGA